MPSVHGGRSGYFNCLEQPLISATVICQNAKINCGVRALSKSTYQRVRLKYSLIQVQHTGSLGEHVLVPVGRICCIGLILEAMPIATPAGT